MKCTLCKNSSSKLVTYRLCGCCTERVEHGCREAVFLVSSEPSAVRKVECDICLEPVLKDNLEQHREFCCISQTVFRCTICDADYQHQAGLWKHLDSHEIDGEAKEEHCRETKVLYEFHKCELCNDQRVYRENLYWSHIHEDHDGFFLKCWYCSEIFRSRKLKTDHAENHCKAKEIDDGYSDCQQSSPLHEINTEHVEVRFQVKDQSIERENSISQDENHLDVTVEQSIPSLSVRKKCPNCGIEMGKRNATHRCQIEEKVQDEENIPSVFSRKQCPDCGREFRKLTTFTNHTCEAKPKVENSSEVAASVDNKEQETQDKPQCLHCKRFYMSRESLMVHIRTLHKKARCTICGLVLANYGMVKSHKLAVHFERAECPHCKQKFSKKNIQNHINSHKEASHLCPECGVLFKSGQNLQVHLKRFHTPGKVPSMKLYIRKEKIKKRKLSNEANLNKSVNSSERDKIHDGTREKHCWETNVIYEIHKCELCSDQRVYRENFYWNHIHEDHDGFFLKCRHCSEKFRSRKLQAYHDENSCQAKTKEDDYTDCENRIPSHALNSDHEKKDHQPIEKENFISQNQNHVDNPKKESDSSLAAQNKCPDCGIKIGKRTVTHRCRVEGNVQGEGIRPSVYARKQCPKCEREFRKTTTFDNHTCKAKARMENSSEATGNLGNKESNLQCLHCKRFYVSRKALTFHVRMLHKKAQCTICGLFLANYGLVKTHKLSAHTERIQCPQCKQTFSKKTFQNHLNSHKEASHLCPECGVMFKSGQNLQVHLKRFHNPGKEPSMKLYIRKEKSKKHKLDEESKVSGGLGSREEV